MHGESWMHGESVMVMKGSEEQSKALNRGRTVVRTITEADVAITSAFSLRKVG